MSGWNKWLWGGLGWTMLGPLGGILGYYLGSMGDSQGHGRSASTGAGDFGAVLMVLFASVMKADNELKKSELEFVKKFFSDNFGSKYTSERLGLFKNLLDQSYDLGPVCKQIRSHMDYQSRHQLVHVLFGLSEADGHIHPSELSTIKQISNGIGISSMDFKSIKAMFFKDTSSAYKILEIEPSSSDDEVKKAYRDMARKFHPDKVEHIGEDFKKLAEEKFKSINEAYTDIKKERGTK